MNNKCFYCYEEIVSSDVDSIGEGGGFHQRCSRKFFGTATPPKIDFTLDQILGLAEQVVKSQKTVTGVQPKLSLGLTKQAKIPKKLTIVGLWGEYILKPQSERFKNLPENESLTMQLASLSGIKTAENSLIMLKSGELAYITKRMDRIKGQKVHMEDMCQLTERLTEHKYKGSYEQIAKAIQKFSANPGLDVTDFYEIVLFSFLTGNNDMHLKNFSLIKTGARYSLAPAYDLVASELVLAGDDEELALTLNGKKKKIKRRDIEIAMQNSGREDKVIENMFKRFQKFIPKWTAFIDKSFLPHATKEEYKKLIISKGRQLEMD
jgi:serine/threonine-protein kinase HipA